MIQMVCWANRFLCTPVTTIIDWLSDLQATTSNLLSGCSMIEAPLVGYQSQYFYFRSSVEKDFLFCAAFFIIRLHFHKSAVLAKWALFVYLSGTYKYILPKNKVFFCKSIPQAKSPSTAENSIVSILLSNSDVCDGGAILPFIVRSNNLPCLSTLQNHYGTGIPAILRPLRSTLRLERL